MADSMHDEIIARSYASAAESMRCTILVQVGSALLALSSFLRILLELNDLLLPPTKSTKV